MNAGSVEATNSRSGYGGFHGYGFFFPRPTMEILIAVHTVLRAKEDPCDFSLLKP